MSREVVGGASAELAFSEHEHDGGGFLPDEEEEVGLGHAAFGAGPASTAHDGNSGGFLPGCVECGCMSYDSVWWSTFGVQLCEGCKRHAKLITKSNAKSAYLLTDRDLAALGTLTRTNPQHKAWKPMQLYLQTQVEEVAQHKHGSVDELEALRRSRMDAKIAKRASKRTAAQRETHGDTRGSTVGGHQPADAAGGASPESEAQRRIRSRLTDEYQLPDSFHSAPHTLPDTTVEEI